MINNSSLNDLVIGIVTFNPSKQSIDRIRWLTSIGLKVFIFDNSDSAKKRFDDNLIKSANLYVESREKNLGLGYGITSVCKNAYKKGFSKIFFLDQDTSISEQSINFLKSFLLKHTNLADTFAAITFDSSPGKFDSQDKEFIQEVSFTINSGTLFFLENLKQIGWHNKDYFVDCVDYEFCLRARHNKLKIGKVFRVPGFNHELEQPDITYKFFNKNLRIRRYGKKRILDAVSGYFKLLNSALKYFEILYFFLMLRSFFIYLSGQIFAFLFIPKDKK